MSVSERVAFNVFLGLNGYDVAQPGRTVTVTPSETVQHFLPSCGFHMGGASVSIFGTNVRVSSKVHVIFGALLRFCSFQSAALLICSNPRHPIGDASISASDDGYVCNECSVLFSYRASYEIAQICPSSFSPHDSKTLVTVHGGQFYHDGSVFCRIDAVIFIGFYMSSEEIACRLVLSDTTLPAKYDACDSNNGVGFFMGLPVLRTDQDVLISNVFPSALSPMLLPSCSCLSGVKSICTTTVNVSQGVTSISAHIGLKTPQYSVSAFEQPVILSLSSSYLSDIGGETVTISGSGFIHSSFMSCLFGSKRVQGLYVSGDIFVCQVPALDADRVLPILF